MHYARPVNRRKRAAILARSIGLVLAALLLGSCSNTEKSAKAPPAEAPVKETKTAAAQPPVADDDMPPILRQSWTGDLDEMAKRRLVRVLLPFRRPEFFYIDGRPAGILQEAFEELERELNKKYKTTPGNSIVVTPLPTPIDQLRERMAGGFGDIAAFGISITEEHKKVVDFTIPTMTGLKIVVLTGPNAPDLKTVDDLAGKEVWIHTQTRLKDDVDALNARLKSQGKAPVKIREVDPILEPGDVAELVNVGTYPIALMQNKHAEFWSHVFPGVKLRMDLVVADDVELGWAIPKKTPQLKAFLDDFIKTHGVGTAFGNTVLRRYLTEAKYIHNATQESELRKFQNTAPLFRKYSTRYQFDALMILAQGYQESRLDQNVKSAVGAVGIMQVMPSTAAGAPVKIPDISTEDNNIHAGVRMMHFLVHEHFNEPGLDQMNRTLLALAAYNAGPAKIRRCRALAKEMGYDPNKWFGNVEVATAKVVGRETTTYVANIYKYYVAYRLAQQTQLGRKQNSQH